MLALAAIPEISSSLPYSCPHFPKDSGCFRTIRISILQYQADVDLCSAHQCVAGLAIILVGAGSLHCWADLAVWPLFSGCSSPCQGCFPNQLSLWVSLRTGYWVLQGSRGTVTWVWCQEVSVALLILCLVRRSTKIENLHNSIYICCMETFRLHDDQNFRWGIAWQEKILKAQALITVSVPISSDIYC